MRSRTKQITIDHIDPRNGVLVCGLDVPSNTLHTTFLYNTRKQNRFVPYRLDLFPQPQYFGDVCEFLIDNEWVVCEFGGELWWTQSSKNGCGVCHTNRGYKTGKLTEETVDGMRQRGRTQGVKNIKTGHMKKMGKLGWRSRRKPVLVTRLSDGHVFLCQTRSDVSKQFDIHPKILIDCLGGKRDPQHNGFYFENFEGEV